MDWDFNAVEGGDGPSTAAGEGAGVGRLSSEISTDPGDGRIGLGVRLCGEIAEAIASAIFLV